MTFNQLEFIISALHSNATLKFVSDIDSWTNDGGQQSPKPIMNHLRLNRAFSGQSYKTFTLVNYNSRVVIWGIFKSGMTLES